MGMVVVMGTVLVIVVVIVMIMLVKIQTIVGYDWDDIICIVIYIDTSRKKNQD